MIVIADSSPINVLVRIAQVQVLPSLFHEVIIPEEVVLELSHSKTPPVVREFIASGPSWLVVRQAPGSPRLPGLDAGEEAAIQLALLEEESLILMDDADGRRVARSQGLRVIGTIGILEEGAVRGHVDFPLAIEQLEQTDFRVDARLVADALARDMERRRTQ